MSMISVQIDELRELADDIESRYGYPTAVKALRDAADTIWQLRDDLQRANDENAKLREELADAPKCETCEAMLDCDECLRADVSHKERRWISAENAKLRELVKHVISRYNDINREFWVNQEPLPCDLCVMERQCIAASQLGRCLFYEYLRELGVEVEG